MLRKRFDDELRRIEGAVLQMGEMVAEALQASVRALEERDLSAAERIVANDLEINKLRFDIEHDILVVIATQQPLAQDLRILAAMLDLIRELERTGDYAKGICKINQRIGDEPLIKPLVDVPRMADKAVDMLRRSLQAFVERDVAAAQAIPLEDDEVDALYNQINRELLTIIMGRPELVRQANLLTWAAHNLERAADRVTNICERIIFTVTGELFEFTSQP